MNIYKSPLNYAGSKHELIPELLTYFPSTDSVSTFYDVFAGGLSVSINTNYKKTISNDIIKPLIDFYQILKKSADNNNIMSEINKIKSFAIDKESKSDFLSIRNKFNETNDPYLFFSLVSSCTNNLMRFNKSFKFNQSFGKRSINDNTVKKLFDYCNILKNKDIIFSCSDYISLFNNNTINKEDFVYLDPPYGNISEAGYNAYWSKSHENDIYNLLNDLDKSGIRFALSGMSIHKGIDNPNLSKLLKFNIINLEHSYEKVARKKNVGQSQEILVTNY